MGILAKLFTWWDGATIGTLLNSSPPASGRRGCEGNRYYRAKKLRAAGQPGAGTERRWVIYKGANDASRVPAEWHGWLHNSYDGVPESHLPAARIWEAEFTPNATGTGSGLSSARRAGARRPPRGGDGRLSGLDAR